MNRQFNPVPMVCPHCGHVFGEQAYFQSFETKVAAWLQGKVAPTATKGYDVFDTAAHPDWTFQVKYATAYQRHDASRNYPTLNWTWVVKRLDIAHPDFFVLFGIDEAGDEHCFLLSRHDFLSYAHRQKNDMYMVRASAKKQSDRPNYRYVPKIWRYVVPDPVNNLLINVECYNVIDNKAQTVFAQKFTDDIRTLKSEGLSQSAIAQRLNISQTSVHRILKGGR